ncbi:MAG TPA: O-antigen ligase family protein [Bacteroidia bacterium]|nr:O-antigen ligase family protein [Bacteroidia bacterium]
MLVWIAEGDFHMKWEGIKNPYALLSISFYLIHVIGLFYSTNMKAGTFDLEQKLSFLLFPLLFFGIRIQNELITKITKNYILGSFLALFICCINALIKYYYSHDVEVFFYTQFAVIIHSSYFAMYLCFAVALLLFKPEVLGNSIAKFSLILIFCIGIFLLSSKSGLIALGFILLFKLLRNSYLHKNYLFLFVIISISIVVTVGIYKQFPKAFERFTQMKSSLTHNESELNTTTSRIIIWKHSVDIIKNNLVFGVGTGDVKDVLKSEYNKQTEGQLIEKQLNAHNQYLQTSIAFGLIGFFILMSILFSVFYHCMKTNTKEGVIFVSLIIFNLLFESMLETQAGVVFIAFFLMLYLSMSTSQLKTKNTNIAT